jgi:hypothetical protein
MIQMIKRIFNFIKTKLSRNKKQEELKKLGSELNNEFSQPLEEYEWVDHLRRRQTDNIKKEIE